MMLLAVDIGNTHIVMGIYRGDDLFFNWRLVTDQHRTADEYGVVLKSLFSSAGISFDSIEDVVISSVVPTMLPAMEHLFKKYLNKIPLVVGSETDLGIEICYENPKEVGADRLVNAVAAFKKCGRSNIVVDFGTATTFDYVSPTGEYMGGAIAPGIAISEEALFKKASKLPRVDIVCPPQVVAKNTVESIQSGIVFGYVGLVDGIVRRIKDEVKSDPFVVATGGLALLIFSHTETIDEVDEYLTLRGLKIIFERNRNRKVPKVH